MITYYLERTIPVVEPREVSAMLAQEARIAFVLSSDAYAQMRESVSEVPHRVLSSSCGKDQFVLLVNGAPLSQ